MTQPESFPSQPLRLESILSGDAEPEGHQVVLPIVREVRELRQEISRLPADISRRISRDISPSLREQLQNLPGEISRLISAETTNVQKSTEDSHPFVVPFSPMPASPMASLPATPIAEKIAPPPGAPAEVGVRSVSLALPAAEAYESAAGEQQNHRRQASKSKGKKTTELQSSTSLVSKSSKGKKTTELHSSTSLVSKSSKAAHAAHEAREALKEFHPPVINLRTHRAMAFKNQEEKRSSSKDSKAAHPITNSASFSKNFRANSGVSSAGGSSQGIVKAAAKASAPAHEPDEAGGAASGEPSTPRSPRAKNVHWDDNPSQVMPSWSMKNTAVLQQHTEEESIGSRKSFLSGSRGMANRVVQSATFDYASGSLVILNAIFIGLQTDYMAMQVTDILPPEYSAINSAFCIVFTMELCLRIFAEGSIFLTGPSWRWNIFDFGLVGLQLVDEVLTLAAGPAGESDSSLNFSFLRVLRILRLVRIMRIIRILRLIGELRAIVSSIMGSLKSLAWTMALVYVFGVYFTQLVSDHRVSLRQTATSDPSGEELEALVRFYGSLGRSILSLYQAITGGVDWDQLTVPLMKEISVVFGAVIALYIAFGVLALLNVVTGVFVESALKSAKEDRDNYMLHHVREIFSSADVHKKGVLEWEDFKAESQNPQMLDFFRSIDVDPSQAQAVFQLLDVEETGAIDLDEFLNGCLSLHGPAKAIDVSTMRYELRMLVRMMNESLATSNRAAVANEQEEMSDESVDQDDDKHLS
eukprot:TRINITY_DN2867_c0_g1_i3.p1 TRINITY_DN2867_c0_g1~~TRINITY_DN2867_c0_g1_i3.p1  ORF type:complete len:756 (+),score=137.94 TRINITY_DN2867_c0_g1_i3:28-2295(+)